MKVLVRKGPNRGLLIVKTSRTFISSSILDTKWDAGALRCRIAGADQCPSHQIISGGWRYRIKIGFNTQTRYKRWIQDNNPRHSLSAASPPTALKGVNKILWYLPPYLSALTLKNLLSIATLRPSYLLICVWTQSCHLVIGFLRLLKK